jgi:hypothetical protein
VELNPRLKRLEGVSKREQANPFVVGAQQPRGLQGVSATASPFCSYHLQLVSSLKAPG